MTEDIDREQVAIVFAAAMEIVLEAPRYIRPNVTAGDGTTAIATAITFSTAPIVATALDALEFTLSTTDATIKLAAGEVLTVKRTKTGSGLLMPSGNFIVEFEPA